MLAPFAYESAITHKLRSSDFSLYYDNKTKTIILKGPDNMKLNILYTKNEADALIGSSGGLTPEDFIKWLLTNITIYNIKDNINNSIQTYSDLANIAKINFDTLAINQDFWELHYERPKIYKHITKNITSFNDFMKMTIGKFDTIER